MCLAPDGSGMPLTLEQRERVDRFVSRSAFRTRGAVVTDLDGTAVLELEGRVAISRPMELGLARVYAAGRPVVLNSLRFPLSVIRTFGAEWYRIAGTPIPTVCLDGSLIGRVVRAGDGTLAYEELAAYPLTEREVREVTAGVRGVLASGADDLLVFWYPRDWRAGERIWTPRPERTAAIESKYRSASAVESFAFEKLEEALLAAPVCMIFLLIDAPQDRRMAYQHTRRSQFVTHRGVDKRFGAERMAEQLGVSLADSVGAGDAETDTFLCGVGLAVVVGSNPGALGLRGRCDTLHVADHRDLGELLERLAESAPPQART
jgi:hydroxymethylpyrimidine pyrophosphatase-like HAD family hydrolase